MKKNILFVLLVLLAVSGCASAMINKTSGQIGCHPSEIVLLEKKYIDWGGSHWTAECKGRIYYCSNAGGGESSQIACTEAQE